MVDYATAFKKPFTDVKKLIIGILLSILPIISWFAMGFAIECSGVGKNKKSKKMPDWDNWGDYFVKGLLSTIIGILYALPAVLILFVGAGRFIFNIMQSSMHKMMPFAFKAVDASMIEIWMTNNWMNMFPGILRIAPILLLSVLLGLLAAYLAPMAILNYIKKKNFGEAFNFKVVFKKAFTQDYFIAWIVVALVFGFAGAIFNRIPWIGSAAVAFVMQVTGYTLFGEVYSQSKN